MILANNTKVLAVMSNGVAVPQVRGFTVNGGNEVSFPDKSFRDRNGTTIFVAGPGGAPTGFRVISADQLDYSYGGNAYDYIYTGNSPTYVKTREDGLYQWYNLGIVCKFDIYSSISQTVQVCPVSYYSTLYSPACECYWAIDQISFQAGETKTYSKAIVTTADNTAWIVKTNRRVHSYRYTWVYSPAISAYNFSTISLSNVGYGWSFR